MQQRLFTPMSKHAEIIDTWKIKLLNFGFDSNPF